MTRTTSRLRIAAVVASAALAAGGLAACTSDGGGDADVITVTSSWTSGQATGDMFKALAEEFTAETGIEVQINEVPNDDVDDVFEADSLAGEETDLVVLNLTPATASWLPDGLVVDTAQYLDDWGLRDKIQPGAVEYWTQGGGTAGFPFIGFNWPIWYNTELLAQAGIDSIPATIDDLFAASDALRAAGIQPMSLGGGSWPAQNFATWIGQQYMAADEAESVFSGETAWCASDNAVKGLELFAEMRDRGVFIDDVEGYDDQQMTTAFFDGQAAMVPSGSWAYTSAPTEIADVTELAGFPVVPGGAYSLPTAFNGHSAGFFLSPKGAEKIDAIQQFMEFMYSQESLSRWVGEASQILDATEEAIGDATSTAPLVVKGAGVTDLSVDFMLLPDGYLPANLDMTPTITEFLGSNESAQELCAKIDALYADL